MARRATSGAKRDDRTASIAARTLRDCIVVLGVLAIGATVRITVDPPRPEPSPTAFAERWAGSHEIRLPAAPAWTGSPAESPRPDAGVAERDGGLAAGAAEKPLGPDAIAIERFVEALRAVLKA